MFPHPGLGLPRGLTALLAVVKTFPAFRALAWPTKTEVRKELSHMMMVLKIQVSICQKAAPGPWSCTIHSLSLFGLPSSWQFINIFLLPNRAYSLVLQYKELSWHLQLRHVMDFLPCMTGASCT